MLRLMLLAGLLLPLAACDVDTSTPMVFDPKEPVDNGDNGDPPEEFVATFAYVQENIFDVSCAVSGCHANIEYPNLSADQSYGNIVNGASSAGGGLIVPNDADNSYIYMKIIEADGIFGSRMPRGRAPLSDDQVAALRQWIERGAPND